jgi:hypothetical protein
MRGMRQTDGVLLGLIVLACVTLPLGAALAVGFVLSVAYGMAPQRPHGR